VSEDATPEQPGACLRGIIPILAMPFTARGDIDDAALACEVDWAIGHRVDGVGLGLASELPRLSRQERERVIELVVSAARGRVPVVVAASAESTRAATRLARHAQDSGASAAMVHPPTFEAPGPRAQWAFFDEILATSRLPVFIQDLPHARVDLDVVVALERDYPGRILLKAESPPTVDTVAAAIEATDGRVPVFGGAGGLAFYSELLRGASGTMLRLRPP
jgi:2-keto-3-deoxy-L-arabinonate dehydratase